MAVLCTAMDPYDQDELDLLHCSVSTLQIQQFIEA